ncbi:uncharacterized protein EV422DRAFT_506961 [Fimicolochytrium jonesii]|uniref:uncharacterized protein n=1 Tax=Fimicolochytrium jonesii TaxID=1396493 RepID=UPI0022FE621C|nr:uncharacterized protein EV422DRAFT_506961 [Fimicolochytrium jonesii]KAI8820248.1 hypothetical protein EV422DRAFT_506961 [Fimicolochytrium jonesii]
MLMRGLLLVTSLALTPGSLAQSPCRTYTVAANDWCEKLLAFNPGLKCDAISPGDRLCVSAGPMPPPPMLPANPDGTCRFKEVKEGGWCEKIATDCGTSLAAFMRANPGLDCQALQANQRMCCGLGVKPSRAPKQNPDGTCAPYDVLAGESCSGIAAKFDLTLAQLEAYNQATFRWMGCDKIQDGARICLSTGTPPVPAVVDGVECGPQSAGNKKCPLNACCSSGGYCGVTADTCDGSNVKRKVGYYAGWGAARKCSPLAPEQLDMTGFTHMIYSFAVIKNGVIGFEDPAFDEPMARRLVARKAQFPQTHILIAVGGWAFSQDDPTKSLFSEMISTREKQDRFIASVREFLDKYKFDGIDIDFEYPASIERNGPPTETANLSAFMQNMRSKLPESYEWSRRTAAPPKLTHDVLPAVSFINIMAYDFHGPWDATSAGAWDPAHYMKAASQTSMKEIEESLALYIRAGIPTDKLNLGVAYYGRSFKLVNPGCQGYGCAMTGGGRAGKCSGETGYLAQFEVEEMIQQSGVRPQLDAATGTKYFTANGDLVTYDDPETWAIKFEFAKKACMGGIMIWATDLNTNPVTIAAAARALPVLSSVPITPPNPTTPTIPIGQKNYICNGDKNICRLPIPWIAFRGQHNAGMGTGSVGISALWSCHKATQQGFVAQLNNGVRWLNVDLLLNGNTLTNGYYLPRPVLSVFDGPFFAQPIEQSLIEVFKWLKVQALGTFVVFQADDLNADASVAGNGAHYFGLVNLLDVAIDNACAATNTCAMILKNDDKTGIADILRVPLETHQWRLQKRRYRPQLVDVTNSAGNRVRATANLYEHNWEDGPMKGDVPTILSWQRQANKYRAPFELNAFDGDARGKWETGKDFDDDTLNREADIFLGYFMERLDKGQPFSHLLTDYDEWHQSGANTFIRKMNQYNLALYDYWMTPPRRFLNDQYGFWVFWEKDATQVHRRDESILVNRTLADVSGAKPSNGSPRPNPISAIGNASLATSSGEVLQDSSFYIRQIHDTITRYVKAGIPMPLYKIVHPKDAGLPDGAFTPFPITPELLLPGLKIRYKNPANATVHNLHTSKRSESVWLRLRRQILKKSSRFAAVSRAIETRKGNSTVPKPSQFVNALLKDDTNAD